MATIKTPIGFAAMARFNSFMPAAAPSISGLTDVIMEMKEVAFA